MFQLSLWNMSQSNTDYVVKYEHCTTCGAYIFISYIKLFIFVLLSLSWVIFLCLICLCLHGNYFNCYSVGRVCSCINFISLFKILRICSVGGYGPFMYIYEAFVSSFCLQYKCICNKRHRGNKKQNSYSNGEREDIFMSQSICEKGCFLAPYVFSLFSFSCIFFFLFYDLLAGIYFCFLQVPIMVVMKAMGLESDQEVVRMVGRDPRLSAMLLPSIEEIYVVKDSKSIIIFVLKERM